MSSGSAGTTTDARGRRRAIDRAVLALAVPALGALIAEPVFVATDTAMVGHLGPNQLAAIGIAGAALQTAIGLMVFLAYATTPLVARRLGAGDLRGAVRAGIDGIWLALAVGIVVGAAGWLAADHVISWFGATPEVAELAAVYLRISSLGIPGMLVLIAATGLFRGLQDTRTPLVIAVVGSALNAGLNAVLIYGAGWGIAGSAIGTAVVQSLMGATAAVLAARHARRHGAALRPGWSGIRETAGLGGWVFLRSVSLRVILLAALAVATAHGTVPLAATTALFTLANLLALALDALAIAGQALVGHALGSGEVERVRGVVRRVLALAGIAGLALGGLLAAVSPVVGFVFTSDPAVLAAIPAGALVLAVGTPIGALAFALDGILLGAADGRHLALLGLLNLAVMLPLLVLVATLPLGPLAAVVAIQLATQVVFMTLRAVTLGIRARGERWIVLEGSPAA